MYISFIWRAKTPGRIEPKFFGGRRPRRNHAIQMTIGLGVFGFWLAEGQSLPFPIDFEGRPYNTHTIV